MPSKRPSKFLSNGSALVHPAKTTSSAENIMASVFWSGYGIMMENYLVKGKQSIANIKLLSTSTYCLSKLTRDILPFTQSL